MRHLTVFGAEQCIIVMTLPPVVDEIRLKSQQDTLTKRRLTTLGWRRRVHHVTHMQGDIARAGRHRNSLTILDLAGVGKTKAKVLRTGQELQLPGSWNSCAGKS